MDPDTPLEQLQKSMKLFLDITMEAECRDNLYRYNSAFMESLCSILDDHDISDEEKQDYFSTTMEQYTAAMRDLFPKMIRKAAPDEPEPESPEPDPEPEPTAKSLNDEDRFVVVEEVEKFNPYHDNRGRFSTANSHTSFTIRTKDPAKQHMADMAIAREKERAAGGAKPGEKPKAERPNPLNDPDTIGGAKRGEPMSREEANNSNANPNFMKAPGCTTNCQSCVVAYEARLRGYDVQAKGNHNNPAAKHLSHYTHDAWIDPATGKPPDKLRNDPLTVHTVKQTKKWLEDTIQPGERYTFSHGWKGRSRTGHIISADKDTSGALRLYDPQVGKTYKGADIDGYLKRISTTSSVYGMKISRLALTRVDNMRINPQYADGIMEAKSP